jgi:hypothetical protein
LHTGVGIIQIRQIKHRQDKTGKKLNNQEAKGNAAKKVPPM